MFYGNAICKFGGDAKRNGLCAREKEEYFRIRFEEEREREQGRMTGKTNMKRMMKYVG